MTGEVKRGGRGIEGWRDRGRRGEEEEGRTYDVNVEAVSMGRIR